MNAKELFVGVEVSILMSLSVILKMCLSSASRTRPTKWRVSWHASGSFSQR